MTKVYYLDDEGLLLKQFERFMTAKGLAVRVFEEADALIAACSVEPPNVLFLDYRLANTTGIEVAGAVDDAIAKVLVTGELSVEAGDKFRAVVTKPFRLSEALDLIRSLAGAD